MTEENDFDGMLTAVADAYGKRGLTEIASRIRSRVCGDCRECCFNSSVESPELTKPAFSRCKHECRAGCAIYEEKPKPCSDYACAWRLGYGGENARPDRSGFVASFNTGPNGEFALYISANKPYNAGRAIRMTRELKDASLTNVHVACESKDNDPGDSVSPWKYGFIGVSKISDMMIEEHARTGKTQHITDAIADMAKDANK